jgi:hypothetical protein
MEVGRSQRPQPEAAGNGEVGSLGEIVPHPSIVARRISAMEKERIQVKLDCVNGR